MDLERIEKLLTQPETHNRKTRAALEALAQTLQSVLAEIDQELDADEQGLRKLRLMLQVMRGPKVPDSLRRKIIRRDRLTCQYCGRQGTQDLDPDGQPWHIDHVVARCNGGPTHSGNLALACASCNEQKQGRSAVEYLRGVAAEERSTREVDSQQRSDSLRGWHPAVSASRRAAPQGSGSRLRRRFSNAELYAAYLAAGKHRSRACAAIFGYKDAITFKLLDEAITEIEGLPPSVPASSGVPADNAKEYYA